MGDEHDSGAEPKAAQSQAWLVVRLVWVGRVFRNGVTAFVKQREGEQAQPWGFDSTETPELEIGRHRTNFGQTNWWNLTLKKSGIACRKQEL